MNTNNFKSRVKITCAIPALVLLLVFVSACAGAPPTPLPTPPPLPSPTTRGGAGGEVVLPTATATPSATAQGAPPTAAPTATPTATPTPVTLKGMADDVARGVGVVEQIAEGDPNKVIFVFEDWHRSRLDQAQNAIMLNRLYSQYRLRHIGLEGFTADKGTLNLTWAHRQPYYQPAQKITGREDVIVQTLKDGEVSGAELLGLIYADVVVHGIDDPQLYAIEQTEASMAAQNVYLAKIAVARMNKEQRATYQALRDQKKDTDAFAFAVSTDKVIADIWWRYTSGVIVGISAEEQLAILDQIQQEADKAGFKPSAAEQAAFKELVEYVRVISRRSDAMAANMLKVAAANPGAPVALAGLGSDHVKRVEELLTAAGVSVVVIRSATRAEQTVAAYVQGTQNKAGLLTDEALKRKYRALSVAPAGTLGRILSGGRKPPPVFDTGWYKNFVQTMQYANEMARGAARVSDQSGGDWKEMAKFLADVAAKWADQFGTTNIAFDGSTFPPQVQTTIVLPNGQTVNFNAQMIPGTYNPNDPDSVPDWDLDALLNDAADDLNTQTYTEPKPGEPQQSSSNVELMINVNPGIGIRPNWVSATSVSITYLKDGMKITEYVDGPLKGTKVTEYTDGPDKGKKVTEYPPNLQQEYPFDKKVTVMPNGTIITEKTFGDVVTEYPDGKKVTKKEGASGSTVTEYTKDGGEMPKGTKIEKTWNGTVITVTPDGTKVTEFPPNPTYPYSSPEKETVTPDGKKVTEYAGHTNIEIPGPNNTTTTITLWANSATYGPVESTVKPDGTMIIQGDRVVILKPNDPNVYDGHIVKPGDKWGDIARQYGVSVGDLMDANPGVDPNAIKAGDALVIPKK